MKKTANSRSKQNLPTLQEQVVKPKSVRPSFCHAKKRSQDIEY